MIASLNQFLLTKIIATIGPACADVDRLSRLIEEGVRVVRINFSHGSFDDFGDALQAIRQASERTQVPVGVLGDLSGPKIRINQVHDNIQLEAGDCVELVEHDGPVRRDPDTGVITIPSNYPQLVREVAPGDRVLIDDGLIRMLAVERRTADDQTRLVCQVLQGGPISTRKGINLPDTDISAPAITDHDRQCVRWAMEHELDFLALSFVRRAEDVQQLRSLLNSFQSPGAARTPIIAKIEKPQAINDIHGICDAAQGIMVARGDLGVEMDLAEVPVIQKRIMQVAHEYGKPAIVATQMLQSMIEQSSPTRAEISDVATAIFDGADAVMLSGETAIGKFPEQAVHVMARTCSITEHYQASQRTAVSDPPRRFQESRYRTAALAHGVSVVVRDLKARLVVTWSALGGGAHYLSQHRLAIPIVAVSSSHATLRKMSLMFGVVPVWMGRPVDAPAFADAVDELLLNNHWADRGDPIVMVTGEPLGTAGVTNEIRVQYVGDVCHVRHDQPDDRTVTRP